MSALDWYVRASWQAAVLVLVVLLAQRVLGRRLSARWRYGLWWIVVARLLLPPLSIPGVDLLGESAPVAEESVASAPEDPAPGNSAWILAVPLSDDPIVARDPGRPGITEARPAGPVESRAALVAHASVAVGEGSPEPTRAGLLVLLWLAGAVGLALWSVIRELRLLRRIDREPLWDDEGLLDLVERGRRELGIGRHVEVIRTRLVSVPAVAGLRRPRLLLPEKTVRALTHEQLRDVVLHELEHVRHHDVAANWLLHAALCLHWMNPLVWLAVSRLRGDRETVRDLEALGRDPARSVRDYGRTILRVVSTSAGGAARPALVAMMESRIDVRRRITMIARYGGRPARGLLVGTALMLSLALLAVLAASTPAVAEPETDPPAAADEAAKSPADPAPRPTVRVLVLGFRVTGDLLEKESRLAYGMEAVSEAILAKRFLTVSGGELAEACRRCDCRVEDLEGSADLRLSVAKKLGVARCVSGWACSFGDRVIVILEVIAPARGLPGVVHRSSCDGVEEIPDALEELLEKAVVVGPDEAPPARAEPVEGAVDFAQVFDRIPEDDLLETYPNPAYEKLVALRDSGRRFGDRHEVDEAIALLADALAHAKRLREDRPYRDEWVARMNLRLDPGLTGFEYDFVSRPPYLLLVEREQSGRPSAKGGACGDALEGVYRDFRALVGERLGVALPALPQGAKDGDGVLRAIVFTRPESFQKYQRNISAPLPPGTVSYYSYRGRTLVVNGGEEGRGPLTLESRLAHEGCHQLQHAYAKIAQDVPWGSPALRSHCLWLQEGFAELMATATSAPGGVHDLATPNRHRLAEWRARMSDPGITDWSLRDILKARDTGDVTSLARMVSSGPRERALLQSLWYSQAWSFCHFLWTYEDGKYREKLLAALGAELSGTSGYAAWQSLWGKAPSDHDWSALELEWRTFTSSLHE